MPGDYGIKVSSAGKAVTSTEPRDYIFNSAYGSVKVYAEPADKAYQTVVCSTGGNTTVTIAHGLSFVPMVMLFTELVPGSGRWYMGGLALAAPHDTGNQVTMNGDADSLTYADTTNIKITYNNVSGSELTVKYYYFIFADNAS